MGACAYVPVTNSPGHYVRVDLGDLRRLEGRGQAGAWFLNGNDRRPGYVRTQNGPGKGRLRQVARLITEAGPGEIVRYRDGDRLNLTRANLSLVRRHRRDETYRE
ncbi:hypothetical protein CA606_09200 [Caulobacter vibrioides]|uniref:HNH endonuclease n=2 Tax=Caulobacter vibrioides TaxID=155892 RepID=A0A290MKH7_CAUVI|nr:hypothetical protein CA606_09200 [Caulobacter vibrioides]